MRAILAFVVFCAIFALSQGAAVRSPAAVQQCQIVKVGEMIAEIVADTYALKADVTGTYQSTVEGLLKCVISSFSTLQTCVTETVQTSAYTLQTDIKTYLTNVQGLVTAIQADLKACV